MKVGETYSELSDDKIYALVWLKGGSIFVIFWLLECFSFKMITFVCIDFYFFELTFLFIGDGKYKERFYVDIFILIKEKKLS